MDALRPYMRLLCGRGTGFGLIAHPLCVGEENGWEVAYVAWWGLGTWHSEIFVGRAVLATDAKTCLFVCFFVFLFFFCDRNASQTPIDFLPLSTASPLYFLLLFSVQPCRACRALVHRTENFSRGHHKNGEGSMVFLECGPLSSATYASPLSLQAWTGLLAVRNVD